MFMVTLKCQGHENIKAKHRTTLEFTRDHEISSRADCVVAVKCNKALNDFPVKVKEALRNPEATVEITIEAGGLKDVLTARGDPKLNLTSRREIVVRKSSFICPRTLAIKASKAAADLNRELVERIRDKKQEVTVTIRVYSLCSDRARKINHF